MQPRTGKTTTRSYDEQQALDDRFRYGAFVVGGVLLVGGLTMIGVRLARRPAPDAAPPDAAPPDAAPPDVAAPVPPQSQAAPHGQLTAAQAWPASAEHPADAGYSAEAAPPRRG